MSVWLVNSNCDFFILWIMQFSSAHGMTQIPVILRTIL